MQSNYHSMHVQFNSFSDYTESFKLLTFMVLWFGQKFLDQKMAESVMECL